MASDTDATSSKQRLIDAAVELFSRQGYSGTGVNEIARVGNAPMGSFYHHFPAGKEALAAHAIDAGGAQYGRLIAQCLAGPGALGTRLAAIATRTADHLQRTNYAQGCAVATTALETVTTSPLLQARAAAAFAQWQGLVRDAALAEGLVAESADDVATLSIALLEGAEMLARVQRERAPLEAAARHLNQIGR